MKVIDRIFEYLKYHNLAPFRFERVCGIANGYLKKQTKGKGTIGSEILEKINSKYKDLSLTWLITGRGQMLNDDCPGPHLSEEESFYPTLGQTIAMLREKISILETALADKEKIIKLLETK